MKKKLIPFVMAPMCAITCAFSLVACGGGDEGKSKHHSEQQWTAAFSAPTTRECYSADLSAEGFGTTDILNYDKNIGYYDYTNYYAAAAGSTGSSDYTHKTIFKEGGHYYTQTYVSNTDDNDYKTYEISAADVTEEINGNLFKNISEKALDLCKEHYADFKANSTFESGDIKGHSYKAKNIDFQIDSSYSIVLQEINVRIDDSDASLYEINATYEIEDSTTPGAMTKYEFQYRNDDSYAEAVSNLDAPARLDGNTFKLVSISVDLDGAPQEGYAEKITNILTDNQDETITAKADGTIDGGIVIDWGDGAPSIAVNTMKYTEDFFNSGTYGDFSVSNAHLGLSAEQTVTLTGNIADGFSYSDVEGLNGQSFDNVFAAEMNQGGLTFTYYFALQGAN